MSSYENTTTEIKGGATSVSFNTDDNFPDLDVGTPLNPTIGKARLTVSPDGEASVDSFQVNRTNIGQEFNSMREQATGILDTARSPSGGRAGTLNAQTVVYVEGMETNLATAEALGYVRRDAQGNYVETSQGQAGAAQPRGDQAGAAQQQQSGQQGQSTDSDYFPVPESNMQALNEVIAPVPQHAYEKTIAQYLANGPDSIDHRQLGQNIGMDPGEVKQRIEFAAQVFQTHAMQSLKGVVADPAEALEWMANEKPREFARAMAQVVHGHQVGELRNLARTYVKSTDPDDATLRHAGFEVAEGKDGTRMVRVNGVWSSVKAAVKAGWI